MIFDRLFRQNSRSTTTMKDNPASSSTAVTLENYKVSQGMFDLLQIVKNGSHYLVPELQDPFVNIVKNDDEYYFIVPNIALLYRNTFPKLFETYYLHELIDLGTCYIGHYDEPYCLWHISKEKTETIKIGVFFGDAHPEKDNKAFENYALKRPGKYTDTFVEYCSLVSRWINSPCRTPEEVKYKYEFNVIDYSELDIDRIYAKYYRRDNADVRRFLRNTDLVPLKDLATIKKPAIIQSGGKYNRTKAIQNSRVPKYPFDPVKDVVDGIPTTEKLYKGDIVAYSSNRDCYLINFEPSFDLYCYNTIIRADLVSPEYLYLYLNSNIAKRIWEELRIHGGGFSLCLFHEDPEDLLVPLDSQGLPDYSNYSDFQVFPVPFPQKSNQYYIDEFNRIANPASNTFSFPEIDFNESVVLGSKILDKIQINDINLKRQISADMEEINTCFENKAYKATLVMCGSVLEAVLLQWLSEINHIDLFDKRNKLKINREKWDPATKDYIRDENGKPVRKEYADGLDDYITAIKEFKRPNWKNEADAAYRIKKARNLVHANLCSNGASIDEALCRRIIADLKTVIESWE